MISRKIKKGKIQLWFERAKEKGSNIYLMVGKGLSMIHVAIDGYTVCKKSSTPYFWTQDWDDLTVYDHDPRMVKRPSFCFRCKYFLGESLGLKLDYTLQGAPKSLNKWAVHWQCLCKVTTTKRTITKTIFERKEMIERITGYCAKPADNPVHPICLQHKEIFSLLDRYISRDMKGVVLEFLGI